MGESIYMNLGVIIGIGFVNEYNGVIVGKCGT